MALSTGAKVFLGIAGFGLAYAAYDALKVPPKKKKKTSELEGSPGFEPPRPRPGPGGVRPGIDGGFGIPETDRDEPIGGWQFRWEQKMDEAIQACRLDSDVTSYADAQACILAYVFPEARPWSGDTEDWQPWMFEARQAVKDEIRDRTVLETGGWGAPGWQFPIWLMFDREFVVCREAIGADNVDAITHCLATKMYSPPEYDWPPQADAPAWQQTFWTFLRDRVVKRLQGIEQDGEVTAES